MLKKMLTTRNLIILGVIVLMYVVSALLGIKVSQPTVSIAAEPIFHIGPITITNSLFTTWVAMILLVLLAVAATRGIPRNLAQANAMDLVPRGIPERG